MAKRDMTADEVVDSESAGDSAEAIKSDAIIKYDSLGQRSKFWRLSEQTNLRTPPDNWLCGRFGDYNWSYPLQSSNSSLLSSFRMANNFPECVAGVDVIADSECIKKLLLMPFDSKHISLMVHRFGNSLLIDEFDLADNLFGREDSGHQWSWLKRFIDDMIVNKKSIAGRKASTRQALQSKDMLCKFLHYSVDQNLSNGADECTAAAAPLALSSEKSSLQLSPKKCNHLEDSCLLSDEDERKEFYFSHHNKDSEMSALMAKQLDSIEDKPSKSQFLRNVLWTFEDIRMLVASHMPIFGDANHPAVSLRLHDMKRPINVLTGMDYWLDNLMSSVPEVVMCYHLEGIVQKYERIKTEDIPHMSSTKSATFAPKVVRNIAQNILSFLKSKATKSGHTYWLFKGKHDDVVKLYDLTALCADYMHETDANPYAIPVAMLLYRVANNMRDGSKSKPLPAMANKMHKLLTNCLQLLDPEKHSQIYSSANYLLSDIYVPNDIDATLLPLSDRFTAGDDEDEDEFESSEGSGDELDNCATLEVNKLGLPDYYKTEHSYDKRPKRRQSHSEFESDLDWDIRCERALKHIVEGLQALSYTTGQKSDENQKCSDSRDETQQMANPRTAIPLHYSSLKSTGRTNGALSGKELTQIKPEVLPNWRTCLEVCLLRKGAQVFCILAELANSKASGLRALKCIRMGVLCYEMAIIIIERSEQTNYFKEPIACLLALCGDIHLKILNSSVATDDSAGDCETKSAIELFCRQLKLIFAKLCETGLKEEFRWAYSPVISSENSVEERLKLCYRCYEEALFQLSDGKGENQLHDRLTKRLGYICNELANYYMNESLKRFNELVNTGANTGAEQQSLSECEVNGLDSQLKRSLSYFERAVDLFRRVGDRENTALMLSNTGRLMRTCAHIFAPTFRDNGSKEFSGKEKHFLVKAIHYYNSALSELEVKGEAYKESTVCHNVNWELSTTLYTIGCLMQEFAPLSTSAYEAVEEEISKYFTQTLSLCQKCQRFDSARHVLYQYRAATVCHRLASLYHNTYRNMSEESERRKKTFKLSDDYYQKSRSICKALNDKEEYLRVTLEEIGLHERQLSQLNGFGSKHKALHLILETLLSLNGVDFSDTESEDEKQKIESLLQLLCARIQFGVKGLIKCLSTKVSKYKEVIERWKSMDEFIGKTMDSKKTTITLKLNHIFNELISSELIVEK